jgi:SAM-dependent methyltransferase
MKLLHGIVKTMSVLKGQIMNDNTLEGRKYSSRINAEVKTFKETVRVHDLPDIFHYWSNKYLKPKLESLGVKDMPALFADTIVKLYEQNRRTVNVASLGSGNCDREIEIVKRVINEYENISIEVHCHELNRDMINRGQELANKEGVSKYLKFFEIDVNKIKFDQKYDIFIANQSLHHFINLEHIFESVRSQMKPGGYFIVSDIIGRNGHMRWPEAYEMVCSLWSLLEKEKKWNHQLKRYEKVYENWDCSKDGFEGIRAQDILPLLIKYFKFELFYAFSNVIDVFAGRSFGHNFDQDDPFDRAFIDFVAYLDEKFIKEGRIKPTHLIARMTNEDPKETLIIEGLTPERCLRRI